MGNSFIYAGAGDDTVNGVSTDSDHVFFGPDDDSPSGGDGANTIYGEDGNDTTGSRSGADFIFGGAGRDRFVFYNYDGTDVVTDFTSGLDVIELRANDANSLANFVSQLIDLGADMQFMSITTGTTILFQRVSDANVFQAGDFLFVTS